MAQDQGWDTDDAPEPVNAWRAEVIRQARAAILARVAAGQGELPDWWDEDICADDGFADDDFVEDGFTEGGGAENGRAESGGAAARRDDGHPPDVRGGYRIRSDDAWAAARHDYLSGDTAETVCARYDLRLGTFRARAARDGWRRLDQGDPEPVDLEAEGGRPDYGEMARHALVRLDRAVRRGRPGEASSWMRLHEKLALMARAAARAGGGDAGGGGAGPDPLKTIEARAALLAGLAQGALRLDMDDPAAVAAFEARLSALGRVGPDPDSDDSDGVWNTGGV